MVVQTHHSVSKQVTWSRQILLTKITHVYKHIFNNLLNQVSIHPPIFLNARLVGTYYGMALASVCPSVHKACKHHTDRTLSARTVKLGTHITYDKRKNPIDFQGHGSKVKVTRYTLLLNLVNTIQTEPFQLGPSNLVHILLMTRKRTLLIFQVMGQRSRSQATYCC